MPDSRFSPFAKTEMEDFGFLTLIAYGSFWLLAAIGFLGCVLPYPGHLFVLSACVAHSFLSGQQTPWYIWIGIVLLGIAGFLIDNLTAMIGAKQFGGSKAATRGALVGVIVGAFFAPIGLVLGPFLGALLTEYLVASKKAGDAAKVGLGATIGYMAGVLCKLVLAGAMVALYLLSL